MIPILYESTETTFATNGIGRLSDIISCTVKEERNGSYECEFQYPITGAHYSDIEEGRIIYCTHDEAGDRQPFVIYGRTGDIGGIETFYAHHISYRLSNIIVGPFSGTSVADVFSQIPTESINTNPFTFWTDKATSVQFNQPTPRAIRPMLGGEENSILDVFGTGDYEFDKFTVKLHLDRGADSGVTIRYGKNLINIQRDTDTLDYYDGIVPYWANENGDLVMLTEEILGGSVAIPLDLSDQFEEEPTETQLRAVANNYLSEHLDEYVSRNIKVDFVQLWQTEEYKDLAPLQRVKLCDTVTVIYETMGVEEIQQKVISVTWNVLLERYDEMELGKPQTTLADVNKEATLKLLENVPTSSMMANAIQHATDLITGASGGYVVTRIGDDGLPYEFLVMDTPDINTAVNVWRFNINGLGHSSTGYDGEYNIAMLMDGQINADLITTGTMSANIIQGGVLSLGSETNQAGQLRLYDESNNLIGEMNKDGLKMYGSSGYVLINYDEGFAGYDLNGNKLYWVAEDEFHMAKGVVEEEISLFGKARFIPISNSANNGVGIVSIQEDS